MRRWIERPPRGTASRATMKQANEQVSGTSQFGPIGSTIAPASGTRSQRTPVARLQPGFGAGLPVSIGYSSSPGLDIENAVLALEAQDGTKLRQRWERMMGGSAPSVSPKLLRLALASQIQASALGGLSVAARRELAQAVGGKSMTQPASAGTKLVRE